MKVRHHYRREDTTSSSLPTSIASDLQMGYSGVRGRCRWRGSGAASSGWCGWEQHRAHGVRLSLFDVGVDDAQRGVRRLDSIRGAPPRSGARYEVDRSRVHAGPYAVV